MRFTLLLLTATLLFAGCSTAPFNVSEKADKLTTPLEQQYSRKEQDTAAKEMKEHCDIVPMLCKLVNDYGKFRDAARVAMGKKVDTTR